MSRARTRTSSRAHKPKWAGLLDGGNASALLGPGLGNRGIIRFAAHGICQYLRAGMLGPGAFTVCDDMVKFLDLALPDCQIITPQTSRQQPVSSGPIVTVWWHRPPPSNSPVSPEVALGVACQTDTGLKLIGAQERRFRTALFWPGVHRCPVDATGSPLEPQRMGVGIIVARPEAGLGDEDPGLSTFVERAAAESQSYSPNPLSVVCSWLVHTRTVIAIPAGEAHLSWLVPFLTLVAGQNGVVYEVDESGKLQEWVYQLPALDSPVVTLPALVVAHEEIRETMEGLSSKKAAAKKAGDEDLG